MIRWVTYNLPLLLLLLVNVVEVLPSHHHHEDEHACAQVDGSFYYVDALEHHHDEDEGPILRGMRLGDDHDHAACVLCHLLTTGLLEDRFVTVFANRAQQYASLGLVAAGLVPLAIIRTRGPPPLFSALLG